MPRRRAAIGRVVLRDGGRRRRRAALPVPQFGYFGIRWRLEGAGAGVAGRLDPSFCLREIHCVDRAGRLTVDFHTVKDTGRRAFALWRSVYLAKQVSLRNRVLVAGDWVRDRVFGRDITRF